MDKFLIEYCYIPYTRIINSEFKCDIVPACVECIPWTICDFDIQRESYILNTIKIPHPVLIPTIIG